MIAPGNHPATRNRTPLIAAQRPDWIICDHYALDAVWQTLSGHNADETYQNIIFNLRLPRIAAAMLVGMALSLAGAPVYGNPRHPPSGKHALASCRKAIYNSKKIEKDVYRDCCKRLFHGGGGLYEKTEWCAGCRSACCRADLYGGLREESRNGEGAGKAGVLDDVERG